MTTLFVPPKAFYIQSSNTLLGQAKLYFFQATTLIDQPVYTTSALNVPHPQPVQADTAGIFPAIYLDPNAVADYRLQLKTSSDVLIYDEDNYPKAGSDQSSILRADLANTTTAGKGNEMLSYRRTTSESAVPVTPAAFFYDTTDYAYPDRFGATGNGVSDDTAAVQAAANVAGKAGHEIKIRQGANYRCTSNITMPVAQSFGGPLASIRGTGWGQAGITFDGAGVTQGLVFQGTSYNYAGSVRDLCIVVKNGAQGGIVFNNCNHPQIDRCWIQGYNSPGRGVYFFTCIRPVIADTLVTGCGSATQGSVEVDVCTNLQWRGTRISGGITTVGGLLIDRTQVSNILGGNIESSGVLIKIGSKSDATNGCSMGFVTGLDLENPVDHYIEIGYGLSGSASAHLWKFTSCIGTPSGASSIPYAVKLANSVDINFLDCSWSQTSANCTYWLESTALETRIGTAYSNFGIGYPWVKVNNVWRKDASPVVDWDQHKDPSPGYEASGSQLNGATPSVLVNATQGGLFSSCTFNNGSPTTMTALTDGVVGAPLKVKATNGNTTLTHSTSVADQFWLTGGANLTLTANKWINFIHNGTLWVQQ